ncbi:hypothetical protein [Butyricimonas sp. Marseille-P3923]|uniref:hypothetical protein n=1 Tax=Butyricimonas sp. Marseille-P3923 TaxID=1987504 RepID=UPI000C07560C|nr:hypothetical protein [Butyricimonas sp. Marseille-P3923]
MKKIGYLFVSGFLLALCGCGDVDEVPPKTNNLTTNYLVPKPKLLTAEEREAISERIARYNEAIK